MEKLRELCAEVASAYPKCEQLNRMQAKFAVSPEAEDPKFNREDSPYGFRITSADGKYVATITVEGFTVSRLRPYDRWESLRQEAQELWGRYQRAVRPSRISRIALRYINQLDIPAEVRDFRDFLTAPPDVPPRLPQTLVEFLTRIMVPLEKIAGMAIITQRLQAHDMIRASQLQLQGESAGALLPILLDIDVFKSVELDPADESVWALADQMRDEKNVIFFESITERMEERCT
jgi:uncharacterized protein (TIGR04255 family)